MGKRKEIEIREIRLLVDKIMVEDSIGSPIKIWRRLKDKYNKKVSMPTLLKIVSEHKTEQPTATADSISEYDDNPDIAKLNESLSVLERDFKNAKSNEERRKTLTAICLARESKLRMQKTLKEKDAINVKTEEKKIIVTFGTPSVLDDERRKKIFRLNKDEQKQADDKKTEEKKTEATAPQIVSIEKPPIKCELCDNLATHVKNGSNLCDGCYKEMCEYDSKEHDNEDDIL